MATQQHPDGAHNLSPAHNDEHGVDSEKLLTSQPQTSHLDSEKPMADITVHPPSDMENQRFELGEGYAGHPTSYTPTYIESNGKEFTTQKLDEPHVQRWNFSLVVAFFSLCLLYTGSQIILYFTAGALLYIQGSLGTAVPNWLLTANTLTSAAILPFVGHITDLLGRRWVTIFGSVLLIISSAVMGTAKTLTAGLIAQVLGGIGTGIAELTALAGVAEIVQVKWRGVALAIMNLGLVPFMPYMIYIVELQSIASWRWSFMIIGCWNLIGLIGILLCYRPPPRHNVDNLSSFDILKRIDYAGFFLSFGGIALLLVALQAGGYQYAWTDAKVLAPLIIGGIMILLFPVWEWKGAAHPLVPAKIFSGQRVVALAFVIGFIGGVIVFALLGFYPVVLQKLYMTSPLTTGVRSIGIPLGILCGGMITNILLSYSRGHIRWLFFIPATIMTAFMGALAAATPETPDLVVAMGTITAFGAGAFLIPSVAVALYACPDEFIGTTAALALTVRFLGASIGTAIFYNILNTKLMKLLPEYVAAAIVPLGFPPSAIPTLLEIFNSADPSAAVTEAFQAVLKVVPDPAVATQIIITAGQESLSALAKSLTYVWYATIAFGTCAMIISLMLPNIRSFMTSRVAVEFS